MVGGLIMAHGDDAGLRLPPQLAPVQVVLAAVKDVPGVADALERLRRELVAAATRVRVDDRTDAGRGRRLIDWELKGVPVRLEVGPRDVAADVVTQRLRALDVPVLLVHGAADPRPSKPSRRWRASRGTPGPSRAAQLLGRGAATAGRRLSAWRQAVPTSRGRPMAIVAAVADAPWTRGSASSSIGSWLTGEFDERLARAAQRAQARREASDYAAETFELSEAKELVRTAARFVTAIEALVVEAGL